MDCPFQLRLKSPSQAVHGFPFRIEWEFSNLSECRELVDIHITVDEETDGNQRTKVIQAVEIGSSETGDILFKPESPAVAGLMVTVSATQHPHLRYTARVLLGLQVIDYNSSVNVDIECNQQYDDLISAQTAEGDVHVGNIIHVDGGGREAAIAQMTGSNEWQTAEFHSGDWKPLDFSLRLPNHSKVKMQAVPKPLEIFDFGEGEHLRRAIFSNGFWMGSHPVTRVDFEAVMGEEGRAVLDRAGPDPKYNNHRQPLAPVTYIEWHEARRFCERLTEIAYEQGALPDSGEMVFRLPTEAEWEFACHGGSGEAFNHEDPREVAFTNEVSGGMLSMVSPVNPEAEGYRKPNRFDLYDMHGLVYEWCLDSNDTDPQKLIDPIAMWDDEDSGTRVCRGGAYLLGAEMARSTSRNFMKISGEKRCRGFIGFRVVLGVELF